MCFTMRVCLSLKNISLQPVRRLFTTSCVERASLNDPENKGADQTGVNFENQLGDWNNRLYLPIDELSSEKHGKPIPKISLDHVGVASVLGRRKVNEDRYLIKEIRDDLLYFGVFDGHGGSQAVEYSVKNHLEIVKDLLKTETNLEIVMKKSFLTLNEEFCRRHSHTEDDRNVGSTATVALLHDGIQLVLGHVGDSPAILCRTGKAMRLCHDHHPEVPKEKARIKLFGGQIATNSLGTALVNGRLAMTRSIGDLDLKSYGVTAEPDVSSVGVKHHKDSFVILLTDGVNFVMSDQEIVDTVGCCRDPHEAASFITDQALHFGSDDNSTAIVIPFGAWGKYAMKSSILSSFGRNLSRWMYHH